MNATKTQQRPPSKGLNALLGVAVAAVVLLFTWWIGASNGDSVAGRNPTDVDSIAAGGTETVRGRSHGLEIVRTRLLTDQRRPEGIWGEFQVEVTVRNTAKVATERAKILAVLVDDIDYYASMMPGLQPKLGSVPPLAPGAEATVVISGFRVAHPEKTQEVVVNVVGGTAVTKLGVKAAFPPGSAD